jgi:two-component system, LytTR family, response regulator
MKVMVVDDERIARQELRRLLAMHSQLEIVGEAANGEEAVPLVIQLKPDVLFLDIRMPGMNGFELLERLDEVPQVIFTTAYDEHALKAFEVNALDYLMKPIAPVRLAAAIAKLRPATGSGRSLEQVFVRDGERCWLVKIPEIFLFESEGNYTRVYFGSERPLILRSLTTLQERLDPNTFFRASRRHVINLHCVKGVETAVDGALSVGLLNGMRVEMSRRQSVLFKQAFSL